MNKLSRRLGRSFFFGAQVGHSLTIEGDLSFFPALADGKLDVEWTQVAGPGGRNVLPRPKEAIADAKDIESSLRWEHDGLHDSVELPLTVDAKTPGLVKARGRARFEVPTAYARLELPCAAGATGTLDGKTAKVNRCENDYLELDWMSRGWPIFVIRDARGFSLATASRNGLALLEGGRAVLDLEHRDLPAKILGTRSYVNVQGKVASILLALPTKWAKRTVPVTATPDPVDDHGRIVKAAAPRTLWEPPVATGLQKTTVDAVRRETHILSRRSYSVAEYNEPFVEVQLPRIDNSLYAKIDFSQVTLVDRSGKPVPHKENSVWVQWPRMTNEVRFPPQHGRGPVDFAHARGAVRIRYPIEMHAVTLTRAAPAAGKLRAKFSGFGVSITGEPFDERFKAPSFAPSTFDVVRAYDKDGERLRRIGPEYKGDEHVLYFWGEPVEVRLAQVDRWEEVELEYDLPPAPLLPADREGMVQ